MVCPRDDRLTAGSRHPRSLARCPLCVQVDGADEAVLFTGTGAILRTLALGSKKLGRRISSSVDL